MTMFSDLPANRFQTYDYSPAHARGLVARILIERASATAGQNQLSQRDIALLAGLDWEVVHTTLKSLMDMGAIRIDRHRMVLNSGVLYEILKSWKPDESLLNRTY